MENLANPLFKRLDVDGKNYHTWCIDVELCLASKNLSDTIEPNNDQSTQDQVDPTEQMKEASKQKQNRASAMHFLRSHVHETLKLEYLTEKDPHVFWENLKERFSHLNAVILPQALYDWTHLRVQDFKTIGEYNSKLYEITSRLESCGRKVSELEKLEKTYSTFHKTNILLQQQYRERRFTRYSELISCLLVAEQNNEILMKNHESRETAAAPVPEANFGERNNFGQGGGRGNGRGRGRGHGRGRGGGRGRGRGRGRGNNYGNHKAHNDGHYSRNHTWKREENTERPSKKPHTESRNTESVCFRCGMKGHWQKTCRTSPHFVNLYQESLKRKGKGIETNFVSQDDGINEGPSSGTHLDIPNFLDEEYDN